MRVRDVMNAGFIKSCTVETKVANAAKIMKEVNVGALPVVDKDKKVVGIITDRDICLSLAKKKNVSASEMSIKEIISSTGVHTVKADATVAKALREMRKNKIGRLPVTDDEGKLKGMLSINNLLSRALVKKEKLGKTSSKDENLAKTIKSLFDRNSSKPKKEEQELADLEYENK